MRKLLTAIILLFLPTWSVAEIYICKSERQFYLNKDPSDSWTSTSSNDSVDIVIDTSQGLRLDGMESEDYVGACRYSSYGGYFCTWEADNTLFQVIVEELANGIFFTYTDLSSSQIMNSDGSCVKSG